MKDVHILSILMLCRCLAVVWEAHYCSLCRRVFGPISRGSILLIIYVEVKTVPLKFCLTVIVCYREDDCYDEVEIKELEDELNARPMASKDCRISVVLDF